MPITPSAYQPLPFVRSGRQAELALRRGEMEADATRRRGEMSQQLWSNLGNSIAGTIGGILKDRQEASARAQAAQVQALKIREAEGALTDQETVRAQRADLSRREGAYGALLQRQFDPETGVFTLPDPREVVSIWGPEKGTTQFKGLLEYDKAMTGRVTDARESAGGMARMLRGMSPQMRQMLAPEIQKAVVTAKIATPEQLAAMDWTSDAVLDDLSKLSSKEPPTRQKIERRNLDGSTTIEFVDPQTAQPMTSAPEQKRHMVTVPGPNGQPVQRLATEDELAQGVAAYRAPVAGPQSPVSVIGPDGKPVYVRPGDAIGRTPASTREQGRPVTSGDAGRIAEFDTALDDLAVLRQTVLPIDPKTGKPATFKSTGTAAAVGAGMPNWATELTGWGVDAKSRQAVIDRVKQVIGKALEGGVLRKEDEYKYEKILPTIKDVADVVSTKLAGLESAIALRRGRSLDAFEDAGYDVARFRQRGNAKSQTVGRFTVEVED